jgi:hypothetical protein
LTNINAAVPQKAVVGSHTLRRLDWASRGRSRGRRPAAGLRVDADIGQNITNGHLWLKTIVRVGGGERNVNSHLRHLRKQIEPACSSSALIKSVRRAD